MRMKLKAAEEVRLFTFCVLIKQTCMVGIAGANEQRIGEHYLHSEELPRGDYRGSGTSIYA